MSSDTFVVEVANPNRVPYDLELRLVTGEASRALAHIRYHQGFTAGRVRALQRAADVLRDAAASVARRGRGNAVPMNLISAAISAFQAPALQASKQNLVDLASDLEKVAKKSPLSPEELEEIDSRLELLRDALTRSSAQGLRTEVVQLG